MKTGLNLQPISEEIVRRVMEQHSFTKLSPAINYIILEYDKLTNSNKPKEVPVNVTVTKEQENEINKPNYSDWFVIEER